MANSRTFILLGLVFAVVLLISSEVSARELAEAAETNENAQIDPNHYGHGHDHEHKHGHWRKHHHGKHGHGPHDTTTEKEEVEAEDGN